jgi:hypothetical protein
LLADDNNSDVKSYSLITSHKWSKEKELDKADGATQTHKQLLTDIRARSLR